jgi:imidazolonepropionase-like amidohydrolase
MRSRLVVSVAVALTGCATGVPVADADIVLRHVHVIDTETGETRRDHAIAIRHDTIIAIVPDRDLGRTGTATTIIDARGAYAIPGLWDAHVHVQQGGPDAALRRAARLLGHGITSARDMGASLADRAAVTARLAAPDTDAPRLLAAGPTFWAFTLPYGDATAKVTVTDTATTQAAVDSIAAADVDFIKVYAGFTPDRLRLLVDAARRRGLTVAGHAQPGATLEQQARLGLVTVEHLDFSTLSECSPRADAYFERVIGARFRGSGESVPALLAAFAAEVDTDACRAGLRRAADAGLVLVPTLVNMYLARDTALAVQARLVGADAEFCAIYLRDFDRADSSAREAVPAAGRRLMRVVRDAGLPVLAGSDAPALCAAPGDGLLHELQLLGASGYTPLEVLQAATVRPSRVLARDASRGRLAPGHVTDVLLLRGDPLASTAAYREPVGLWTRGRWRDDAALRALRTR